MEVLIGMLAEYGVIASGFIYLMWQSGKEKEKLMDFVQNQTATLEKINSTLTMFGYDLRDIRRRVGLEEFNEGDK